MIKPSSSSPGHIWNSYTHWMKRDHTHQQKVLPWLIRPWTCQTTPEPHLPGMNWPQTHGMNNPVGAVGVEHWKLLWDSDCPCWTSFSWGPVRVDPCWICGKKWEWPVWDLRSGTNACADWTLQLILKRCGNFWAEHKKEAEGAVQGKIDELTFYFKRSHAAVKPKYIQYTQWLSDKTKWPTREWWENEDDKRHGHSIHWLTSNKI